MNLKFSIRDESHADIASITEVTEEAFKTLEISNHTEQFVINALRAAGALILSLIAEIEPFLHCQISSGKVLVKL